MTDSKKVLMIGLDPAVVDYDKWPGLSAEKLEAALRKDEAALNALGFAASICFVDHGAAAERTVADALARSSFDCIMVGAGVRTDPDEFLLFEKLVNLIHERAPGARICFNTGPTDSLDAVRRWITP